MNEPIRTLITADQAAEHRKREGYKSASLYARLNPELGEIGCIAINGECLERIIIVRAT